MSHWLSGIPFRKGGEEVKSEITENGIKQLSKLANHKRHINYAQQSQPLMTCNSHSSSLYYLT